MTTVTEHATKLKNTYDSEMFIGRLGWYTITEEVTKDHTEFCQSLVDAFKGVTPSPELPPAPRATDIFKRACTNSERNKVPTEDSAVRSNYNVRPAGHDADHVWRVIVKEDIDSEGHRLSYTELVQVSFDRKNESIHFDDLEGVVDLDDASIQVVNEIKWFIKDYFKTEAGQLTAYAIRELVRKFLEKQIHAVKVRPSGGVYFIQEKFVDAVEAITTVVNDLDPTNAVFHTLPLLDDSKQREMLRVAFEGESVGAVEQLIGEMSEIIKSGKKISADRYAQFKESYDYLLTQTSDYSDLLDDAMAATHIRLEAMQSMIFDLMNNVKLKESEKQMIEVDF